MGVPKSELHHKIPSQIYSEVKNPKYNPKYITNTIRNYLNVPRVEQYSKLFWPKKNQAGGVLRERGLGTYTSPTLGFNKSHLLYSKRKKDKKDQF